MANIGRTNMWAPSIGIPGNKELLTRVVITIQSVCTLDMDAQMHRLIALCVFVCVRVDIEEVAWQ